MPLAVKTWMYFAIMAAITLLLLWLFQFIYFDLLYYDKQSEYFKEISDDLFSRDYGANVTPEQWAKLEEAAHNQNLSIYIFTFKLEELSFDEDGKTSFPLSTEVRVYTPYSNSVKINVSQLTWEETRTNKYLGELFASNGGSFTFIESNEDDNSPTDYILCGGKLKGDFGSDSLGKIQNYFCLIGTISTSNYTITVMQNMLLVATAVILAISIIMALLFSRMLSNPINKLAGTANQLAKGDFNVNFESKSCDEVRQLANSLNFAKEELRKTEQMRRDFIANVSHDLRTPLTMIKAYAEMIRDLSGGNEEKRTKHCQIIIDESDRLSGLVGDIQKLSKLQSGTDAFEFKTFDMGELCQTVINRFGIMSEKQGFVFECECDRPAYCKGDYSKLEQVLYNLIGNAVNYTGNDKRVIVRCKVADSVRVEISDTGKGIAPEEIDSVWERYYRANQKKRNIIGSGLGLNIVKIILEGHKAAFGVNSVVDQGTTFWFELPKADTV